MTIYLERERTRQGQRNAWQHDIHFYRPPVEDENYRHIIGLLQTVQTELLPELTIFNYDVDITTLSQRHVNIPARQRPRWSQRDTTRLKEQLMECAPASADEQLVLRPLGFIALQNRRGHSIAVSFKGENAQAVAAEHRAFVRGVSRLSGFEVFPHDMPRKLTIAHNPHDVDSNILSVISEYVPEQLTVLPTIYD